jgi:predicted AlkP superfamily pyrophosphatase or phosphodiesterase
MQIHTLRHMVFAFLIFTSGSTLTAQEKNRKAVFVIVDGIPADVIEKLPTPAIDAISKEGGYTRAHVGGDSGTITETPTISAVGYNSLLTGTWVNKHNVWDNDIAGPNYNYWNIFRFFKQQYPNKKTAVFSTWLDNRTKLIGSEAKAAGNLQPDYYFDGLEHDTILYPHDKQARYIHLIDEAVVDTAAAVIKRMAPDLSWVYLEYTDDMGHRYGDSKQFYDAVETMDKQMYRLWQAIDYRRKNFNEDWVIYITTDHGRDAKTGRDHGGQSSRERTTWIVTNEKKLNGYFKNNPGIVDIMPTLARFLNLSIPRQQLMEIDGISLTGKVPVYNLKASQKSGIIHLSWKVLEPAGKAKIWLSATNHFKTGGKDEYVLVKEVPVAGGKAVIDVKKYPSEFYKLVLETPHNFLNCWITIKP